MPAIRRYIFRALTVLTVIAPMPFLASPSAAQDVARGAVVFKRCQICHSTTAAGGSTIGPNLSGVLGRKAGAQKGFTYSKAMASAGFLWDAKKLDAFMAKPQSVVPGNRMAFGGIAADAQRADLLAYLKSLGK